MFKFKKGYLFKSVTLSFMLMLGASSVFATDEVVQTSYEVIQISDESNFEEQLYVPEVTYGSIENEPSVLGVGHIVLGLIEPDAEGVSVTVSNVGGEALDNVIVSVIATGNSSYLGLPSTRAVEEKKSQRIPVGTKTFRFDLPMERCSMTYVVYIEVQEEGNTILMASGDASLDFKESSLSEWHPGTFASCRASVDYHYSKHKSEIGADNLREYLRAASTQRAAIAKAVANLTAMTLYKITTPDGYIPSTKFTLYGTSRYLTWTNAENRILSYGGRL